MYRTYSKFIFHTSKLYYSVYGEGENVLLIFHGFGHTHKNMRAVEEALSMDYKIYNFDLFFHGFSEWNHGDNPLSHDYWQQMLSAFLAENHIERFSILGFSLGGRVALSTVELFPTRIDNLYLIAPDGVKRNFWYNLATTKIFRGLFRGIILDPTLFYDLVRVLKSLNLLDKSVARFSSIQMNSRDKRRRVYYTWTVFKGITPHLESVINAINTNRIQTEIYIGAYDRIISAKHVKRFANKLKQKKLVVLTSGHNNLLDEVAAELENEIQKR